MPYPPWLPKYGDHQFCMIYSIQKITPRGVDIPHAAWNTPAYFRSARLAPAGSRETVGTHPAGNWSRAPRRALTTGATMKLVAWAVALTLIGATAVAAQQFCQTRCQWIGNQQVCTTWCV